MRKRPNTIPTDARYDVVLDRWQLGGELDGTTYLGRWRFWTRDGRPLADVSFNVLGLLHGTSIWHRYPDVPARHPLVPTPSDWPGGPVTAYRAEQRYEVGRRVAAKYFDAQGNPLRAKPRGTERPQLDGYVANAFADELARWFPRKEAPTTLCTPPRSPTSWPDVAAAVRSSAEAFDALVRAGQIPMLHDFQVTSYALDFDELFLIGTSPADYLAIAGAANGDFYVLEFRSGKVKLYSREDDIVVDTEYFTSLDTCCWTMLRVCALRAGIGDASTWLDEIARLPNEPAARSELTRLCE